MIFWFFEVPMVMNMPDFGHNLWKLCRYAVMIGSISTRVAVNCLTSTQNKRFRSDVKLQSFGPLSVLAVYFTCGFVAHGTGLQLSEQMWLATVFFKSECSCY